MMAMLEDGLIDLDDSVFVNHGAARNFYGLSMKDAKPHRFEVATAREVFHISSNVGIAMLADSVYNRTKMASKFTDRLKQFRLNEPTGIDLKGEGMPYIKNAYDEKERWSKSSVPWMATGYECQLTPLQTLCFYNAVANEGTMVKPHLVSEIQSMGEPVKRIGTTVLKKKIASDRTIELARQLLEGVVLEGTAKDHQSELYSFAGKTGTAVIDYSTPNRVGRKRYQASFVGYFPADEPMYSIIVVINDPAGGVFYGSQVATPVFREIADKIVLTQPSFQKRINIGKKPEWAAQEKPANVSGYTKELERVYQFLGLRIRKQSKGQWASVQVVDEDLHLQPLEYAEKEIPDVRGMGIRDALYVLENRGMQVQFQGAGKVKSQHPLPGTKPADRSISLVLN